MAGGLSSAGGDASLTVTGQVISILTILALIFLDFAMERLEDAAAGHKHGQALLRAAYKELTVLGMVSFLMLVFASSNYIAYDAEIADSFEATHLMLFILAICYIFFIMVLILLSMRIGSYWGGIERAYAWDPRMAADLDARYRACVAALGLPGEGGGDAATAASTAATASSTTDDNDAGSQSVGGDDDATTKAAGGPALAPARPPRPSSVIRATAHAHPPAPPITVGRVFGLLCPCVRFPLLTHTVAVSTHGAALLRAAATRPSAVWRYVSILPAVRFLQQRARFIAAHDLPPHFSFAVYLRECRHHSFMTLVAIPPAAWAGLGFVCTVDLFLRSLSPGGYGRWVTPSFIVGAGAVGIMAVAGVIYWKMNAINWRVLRENYYPPSSGGGEAAGAAIASPSAATSKRGTHATTPATPAAKPPPSPTDLFWFRSPLLMLRLLQGVVFASALLIALVVRFWYLWSPLPSIISSEADPWGGQTEGRVFIPIMAVAAVAHSLFLLQHVVPLYIVVLHTGDVVDLQLLIESVERQRADEKRRRREERARALYYRLLQEVGPPPLRARVRAAVGSHNYRALLTMAILVDVFFVAMLVGAWLSPPQEQAIFVAQVVLSGLILLDQAVLVYADKRRAARYWRGPDRLHNLFDLLVTVAAFVSSVLEMVLLSRYLSNGGSGSAAGGGGGGGGNATATNSSLVAGWAPRALEDALPLTGGEVPAEDALITALRVIRLFVVFRLPALKPAVHERAHELAAGAEAAEHESGEADAATVSGGAGSTTTGGGSSIAAHAHAHAGGASHGSSGGRSRDPGGTPLGMGVPSPGGERHHQNRGSSGSGGHAGAASPSAAERYYAEAAAVITSAAAEREAKARRRARQHELAAAAAAAAGTTTADDDIVAAAASDGQLEVAADAAVAALTASSSSAAVAADATGIDSPGSSADGSVHGGGGSGGSGSGQPASSFLPQLLGDGGRHVMLSGHQAGTALRAAASAAVELRRETLASLHVHPHGGGGSGATGTPPPPPLHEALERMLVHGDGDVEAGGGSVAVGRAGATAMPPGVASARAPVLSAPQQALHAPDTTATTAPSAGRPRSLMRGSVRFRDGVPPLTTGSGASGVGSVSRAGSLEVALPPQPASARGAATANGGRPPPTVLAVDAADARAYRPLSTLLLALAEEGDDDTATPSAAAAAPPGSRSARRADVGELGAPTTARYLQLRAALAPRPPSLTARQALAASPRAASLLQRAYSYRAPADDSDGSDGDAESVDDGGGSEGWSDDDNADADGGGHPVVGGEAAAQAAAAAAAVAAAERAVAALSLETAAGTAPSPASLRGSVRAIAASAHLARQLSLLAWERDRAATGASMRGLARAGTLTSGQLLLALAAQRNGVQAAHQAGGAGSDGSGGRDSLTSSLASAPGTDRTAAPSSPAPSPLRRAAATAVSLRFRDSGRLAALAAVARHTGSTPPLVAVPHDEGGASGSGAPTTAVPVLKLSGSSGKLTAAATADVGAVPAAAATTGAHADVGGAGAGGHTSPLPLGAHHHHHRPQQPDIQPPAPAAVSTACCLPTAAASSSRAAANGTPQPQPQQQPPAPPGFGSSWTSFDGGGVRASAATAAGAAGRDSRGVSLLPQYGTICATADGGSSLAAAAAAQLAAAAAPAPSDAARHAVGSGFVPSQPPPPSQPPQHGAGTLRRLFRRKVVVATASGGGGSGTGRGTTGAPVLPPPLALPRADTVGAAAAASGGATPTATTGSQEQQQTHPPPPPLQSRPTSLHRLATLKLAAVRLRGRQEREARRLRRHHRQRHGHPHHQRHQAVAASAGSSDVETDGEGSLPLPDAAAAALGTASAGAGARPQHRHHHHQPPHQQSLASWLPAAPHAHRGAARLRGARTGAATAAVVPSAGPVGSASGGRRSHGAGGGAGNSASDSRRGFSSSSSSTSGSSGDAGQ